MDFVGSTGFGFCVADSFGGADESEFVFPSVCVCGFVKFAVFSVGKRVSDTLFVELSDSAEAVVAVSVTVTLSPGSVTA